MEWTVLPQPHYSLYLVVSNFHLFGPLKDALRGRAFCGRNTGCMRSSDTGIQCVTQSWKRCVDNEGECVEK